MPEGNTLEQEIQACIDALGCLDPGCEEYDTVLNRYERLVKISQDYIKIEVDREKIKSDENVAMRQSVVDSESNRLKAEQIRKDTNMNMIKLGTVVGITAMIEVIGMFAEEFRVFARQTPGISKGLIKLGLK